VRVVQGCNALLPVQVARIESARVREESACAMQRCSALLPVQRCMNGVRDSRVNFFDRMLVQCHSHFTKDGGYRIEDNDW